MDSFEKKGVDVLYTSEEKQLAIKMYHECGSIQKTVRILGYPNARSLFRWVHKESVQKAKETSLAALRAPESVRMEAIHRCIHGKEVVRSVAEEMNLEPAVIRFWLNESLQGANTRAMSDTKKKKRPKRPFTKSKLPATATELEKQQAQRIAELEDQLYHTQLKLDLMIEIEKVLKKEPGVDRKTLPNREKAVVVDAMRSRYPLPDLLSAMQMPRSCYYYQVSMRQKREDKQRYYAKRILALFEESKGRYGYRRLWAMLKREGIVLSEKVVRRIMRELELHVKAPRRKPYSSYKGEITPAVKNLLERDFHAEKPNEKWLTDITEFALPAGKVYLSPLVDCFDGLLVTWKIGTSPNAAMVNEMLDMGKSKLKEGEHPIVHSDRGSHYRWPGWIERMERYELTRSMSKKGCSPDNAACEGVFGRIKNEMFYGRKWDDVSLEKFMETLNEYLIWYNEKRIKRSLGNMSPMEYRRSLGLV